MHIVNAILRRARVKRQRSLNGNAGIVRTMLRGVRQYLVGSAVLAALAVVAGCSHYMFAEREPWRHDAELACLNSGAVPESAGRVRISAISGPGICGMDYPIKVTELGQSAPLGYTDEPLRPPGGIPNASMPPQFSAVQSKPLPPPQAQAPYPPPGQQPYGAAPYGQPPYGAQNTHSAQPYGARPYGSQPYGQAPAPYPPQQSNQPPYGQQQYGTPRYGEPQYASPSYRPYGGAPPPGPQAGAPISLAPPGVAPDEEEIEESEPQPDSGAPNYGAPTYRAPNALPPAQAPAANEPIPPLGPPAVTGSVGPVAVRPAATLACPLVAELDKWIGEAVQPAALRWFGQPVVEIKQISAYSCRGMNGNPNAHISEHAFGNALDIAEFDLADGRKVSVQHGWHGTPEEQGFLHDVQGAACRDFTTVLAPGANVYHYNHIHVDLMRRARRPVICEPGAVSGEVVAARARAHYAAQHGEPRYTGSIGKTHAPHPLGYTGDDRLPEAVPGED
jgi:hypothetical protein